MKAYSLGDIIRVAEAIEGYFDNPTEGTKERAIVDAAIDIQGWAEMLANDEE